MSNYNDEIDQFIRTQKLDREVTNYIDKHIYPSRLFTSTKYTNNNSTNNNQNNTHNNTHNNNHNTHHNNNNNNNTHNNTQNEYYYEPIYDIPQNDIITNLDSIHTCLNKCSEIESAIQQEILRSKEVPLNAENNVCPICIEDMGTFDYFMPKCGHKVCRSCAIENMFKNKYSGRLCGICRKQIL